MTESNPTGTGTCAYQRLDGSLCPGPVEGDGELCFWHDPKASKEGEDVRPRLEEWAKSDESMEGFVLRYARLEGMRISHPVKQRNLRGANLWRASLQGASMFNSDLRGAELLKANLAGANLNESLLENSDLLGANFDGTRLERVEWGACCKNETEARQAVRDRDQEEALKKFEEAEEVYRTLRRTYDGAGRFEQAGVFFRREMTMRRMLMPRWSGARLWSKVVDIFCAYGESPPRVILSAILLNLAAATVFFFIGINGPDGPHGFDPSSSLAWNLESYFDCVYYSVVTFTTLGYGEFTPPTMVTRSLAATHAFVGAFMMAMFVAVFGKKMTRG